MKRLFPLLITLALTACGGGNPTQSSGQNTPTTPVTIIAAAPQPVFAPSVVVLEGDSLTQVSAVTSWPTAVQADATFAAEWKDFAIGGSTTTMMLARYGNVRAAKPIGKGGVFILNGGANDLSYPHGDDPAAEVYGRLKTMWAQARADGFKVIAFTVHNGGSVISPEFAKAQYARLNAMIRADASLYDALVENDKLFPDTADKSLLYDGLHFTPAANEKVRVAVNLALATLK